MNATTTTTGSGTVLVDGRPWWALAACRLVGDPEIFYPLDLDPTSPAVHAARRVCTGCPVLPECLADALVSEDPARRWGVIGGTTPDERAALYARQHAAAVDPIGAAA
jgi:WhiB family transcriptional regulator, redox-sensing transcriptional regulator